MARQANDGNGKMCACVSQNTSAPTAEVGEWGIAYGYSGTAGLSNFFAIYLSITQGSKAVRVFDFSDFFLLCLLDVSYGPPLRLPSN
ncbi:hypothetical protein COLO4_23879 [Corchorus olitorius]|uniref:Uncharacterized protein n=1 Tax=Corchorus olitorius TaxID=93759 RepID=A0A1R3IE67_9ROSI|nr:hypothetical protein COLO4_23879 [Corchorus olitorius]